MPFIKKLPKGHKFAVEIRNRNWLVPQVIEALRDRNVAMALVDQVWMPRPAQLFDKLDPITSDFAYVRWLGDRKRIEKTTKTWDQVIVHRSGELAEWVEILRKVHKRRIQIFAYANNHYAGHAPATVELFQDLWGSKQRGQPEKFRQKERTLFE